MIRLDRHIDLLLMKHDCVILPGFGGFVKHHISARFDGSEGVMLPPAETVGFNPRLTLNDSLLVQSYAEAYDYSFPEAADIVAQEIEQLRGALREHGKYEIGSVGALSAGKNGSIVFEPASPCIITPCLYGLSGIDTVRSECFITCEESAGSRDSAAGSRDSAPGERVITIPLRAVHRVAAACIVLVVLAAIPYVCRNAGTKQLAGSIGLGTICSLVPGSGENGISVSEDRKQAQTTEKHTKTIEIKTDEKPLPDEKDTAGSVTDAHPAPMYTVVLASRTSERNAAAYVEKLRNEYRLEARMVGQGMNLKVVCGSYSTQEEAQKARRQLPAGNDFTGAWVTTVAGG